MEKKIEHEINVYFKVLEYCRLCDLDYTKHVQKIIENNRLIGFRVVNENFETASEFLF
ncbi:MAG TPA: hypothetical protein PLM44_02360 [bacterium]|nr:hypothetical protein [bacterium]